MPAIPDTLYTGAGFSDWEIGDISIIKHDGVYHLFHLIIPNHDYIAHAISYDGISWQRKKNAIFVGDPGEWDDDMLWTMHVCEVNGHFEMYYTGLQRQERGVASRVGLAVSDDLYNWQKVRNEIFPFGPQAPHYETMDENPRKWLSYRDPYRFTDDGITYFLVCARAAYGPVYRRGCVALVKMQDGALQHLPPLHYPMVYDDVECPCAFILHGKYYLLGSIREDIKVRYWFAQNFLDEYHCFHANVLLPQGNYAARVLQQDGATLIYAFFFTYGRIDSLRVLLPPKQLDTDKDGRLILRTYHYWQKIATQNIGIQNLQPLFNNTTAQIKGEDGKWVCGARSGYEVFQFEKPANNFIWEGDIKVEGMGKLGLVSDVDEEGSGYYFSFDVKQGHLQLRAWGHNPHDNKTNFTFITLQDNVFALNDDLCYRFRLIRYGGYIELSIDDIVKLTLVDYKYNGNRIGLYSASSVISLDNSSIKILPEPKGEYAKHPSEVTAV